MRSFWTASLAFVVAVLVSMSASAVLVSATPADWNAFVIRDNATSGAPAAISVAGGVVSAQTPQAGQKVGYGTNILDGMRLDSITRFQVTRTDSASLPYAPYINMWVTDGTHYAVISLEPSNYPALNWTHDLDAAQYLSIKPWIYETNKTDLSWIAPGVYAGTAAGTPDASGYHLFGPGATPLTLADIGHLTLQAPTAAQLAGGLPGVGTGAPREKGTNTAYSFNLVVGDTQANYVGGYTFKADVTLQAGTADQAPTAVPEPMSAALAGLGVLTLAGVALRRRAA